MPMIAAVLPIVSVFSMSAASAQENGQVVLESDKSGMTLAIRSEAHAPDQDFLPCCAVFVHSSS